MSRLGIFSVWAFCLFVYMSFGETAMWVVAAVFGIALVGVILALRRDGRFIGPSTLIEDGKDIAENFGFRRETGTDGTSGIVRPDKDPE